MMKLNILNVAQNNTLDQNRTVLETLAKHRNQAVINRADTYYIQTSTQKQQDELDLIYDALKQSDDLLYQSQLCIELLMKISSYKAVDQLKELGLSLKQIKALNK